MCLIRGEAYLRSWTAEYKVQKRVDVMSCRCSLYHLDWKSTSCDTCLRFNDRIATNSEMRAQHVHACLIQQATCRLLSHSTPMECACMLRNMLSHDPRDCVTEFI